LRALEDREIDTTGWHSRRLDARLVESADLILVAERSHLVAVTELQPSAARCSLPLLQFAHLAPYLGQLPLDSAEQFAAGLDRSLALALSRVVPLPDYAIADPVPKGRRAVERCTKQIARAVQEILFAFTPSVERV
jgi:protein-tyrosine-phosphatase